MLKQYDVEIEQVLLNYDPLELAQWRKGDPALVPERDLQKDGPGLANGYGYGEFFVKRYLEGEGYEVVANDFDLYSKKSKYEANNLRIKKAIGEYEYNRFKDILHRISDGGIGFEQPDLCIISPELFFVEVKRNKDILRPPQSVFAVILWEVLRIPFKVYKLLPYGQLSDTSPIYRSEILPSRYFE